MIKNYLITALRNISRNRLYTLLNVCGLAAGLVSCLFIYLYVEDELSFDAGFSKRDRIFRIQSLYRFSDNHDHFGITAWPLVPVLLREFPELESGARLLGLSRQNFNIESETFEVNHVHFADSTFFDLFDFEFVAGNPETALDNPESIVLAETDAKRIFGREHAVGKLLTWNNRHLKVTGIIRDADVNTHIETGAFMSMSTLSAQGVESLKDNWGVNNSYSYILLGNASDSSNLQAKLDTLVNRFVMPYWKSFGFDGEIRLFAEPLRDIHFNNYLIYDTSKKGNAMYVSVFTGVAVLILILACMNFINLAVASATRRNKEVAIRKVSGAGQRQLMWQFIGEAFLITLLASFVALMLLELMLPVFNGITDKNFQGGNIFSREFLLLVFGLILLISFTAGSYPAFYIASLKPNTILKGKRKYHGPGTLRSLLVTVQFALSLAVMAGTLAVFTQVDYLRHADVGFSRANKLIISLPPGDSLQGVRVRTLRDRLNNLNQVESAARTAHLPGGEAARFLFRFPKPSGGFEDKTVTTMYSDDKFLEMMDIKLVQGDYFREEDGFNVALVNEKAVEFFNWENPLHEKLVVPGDEGSPAQELNVVGVVKDFNFSSLHNAVEPLAILPQHPMGSAGSMVVSLKSGDLKTSLAAVSDIWQSVFPSKAFDYTFIDDDLKAMYAAEDKMFKVFIFFAGIALILSCLGLAGLASFSAQQRTREIGIRKVMGARVTQILLLINREYIKLYLFSCLIAIPVTYYFIRSWLAEFAYQAPFSSWIFLIPVFFILGVTLLTVTLHVLRTALMSPVYSLRYE